MSFWNSSALRRGLIGWIGVLAAITMTASPAQAALHFWRLQELYTNSSGTLQFIELHDPSGGQNFIANGQIIVSNIGNTQTHTFTVPGSTPPLSGSTFNHSLLFATSGADAAGGPAPDFVLPNGFLFTDGGTISFFGANSGPYSALPTDGTMSRIWGGGNNAINSPTNYAGATGVVVAVVPEPVTLSAAGGIFGLYYLLWRRRPAANG